MDDFYFVGTILSFVGVIVPILIAHERRLTRIEGKLDVVIKMVSKLINSNASIEDSLSGLSVRMSRIESSGRASKYIAEEDEE